MFPLILLFSPCMHELGFFLLPSLRPSVHPSHPPSVFIYMDVWAYTHISGFPVVVMSSGIHNTVCSFWYSLQFQASSPFKINISQSTNVLKVSVSNRQLMITREKCWNHASAAIRVTLYFFCMSLQLSGHGKVIFLI